MASRAGIASGLGRISDYFMRKADEEDFDKRAAKAEKAAEERAARKEAAALKRTAGRSEGYLGAAEEGPPAVVRDKFNKDGDFLGTETASPSEQRGYQALVDRNKAMGSIAEQKLKDALEDKMFKRDIERRKVSATEKRAQSSVDRVNRPIISRTPKGGGRTPDPLEAQKRYQEVVEKATKAKVPLREYAKSVGVDLEQFQKWMHPDGFGGGQRKPKGPDIDPMKLDGLLPISTPAKP